MASDTAGNIYVGGDFTIAGCVPANRIAKWERVVHEEVLDAEPTPVGFVRVLVELP